MNCREWKNGFTEWQRTINPLDEPWPGLPHRLAGHLEECSACRSRYETLSSFARRERWQSETPPALADRVMAAVLRKAAAPGYRRFPIPAFAAAVLAAALAAVLLVALPGREPASTTVTVKLLLAAPHARTVAVAGDWNMWNPEVDRLSDANGDGVWEIELHLEKNREYRYQFIINGESWIHDPRAGLQVEDGFGGTDSVLDI
jgi:hypothetical protein